VLVKAAKKCKASGQRVLVEGDNKKLHKKGSALENNGKLERSTGVIERKKEKITRGGKGQPRLKDDLGSRESRFWWV